MYTCDVCGHICQDCEATESQQRESNHALLEDNIKDIILERLHQFDIKVYTPQVVELMAEVHVQPTNPAELTRMSLVVQRTGVHLV
jgi:hypothetical protein